MAELISVSNWRSPVFLTGGGKAETAAAYVDGVGDNVDNEKGGGGTDRKVPIFLVFRGSMLPLKGSLTAGTAVFSDTTGGEETADAAVFNRSA